jgi:hypothetical protein
VRDDTLVLEGSVVRTTRQKCWMSTMVRVRPYSSMNCERRRQLKPEIGSWLMKPTVKDANPNGCVALTTSITGRCARPVKRIAQLAMLDVVSCEVAAKSGNLQESVSCTLSRPHELGGMSPIRARVSSRVPACSAWNALMDESAQFVGG